MELGLRAGQILVDYYVKKLNYLVFIVLPTPGIVEFNREEME